MKLIVFTVSIHLLFYKMNCDLKSPCPHMLTYTNITVKGRWEGLLVLRDREGLQGISLSIALDSKADVLVNDFGETTTLNNQNFVINGLHFNLLPTQFLRIKFTVKYNKDKPPPNIASIKLNGVEICANGLIKNSVNVTDKPKPKKINQYDPMCGMKPHGQHLSYDAQNADEYWPWHAAIMMLTNPEIHYHCGGTLITDRFVLTAARCVTVASKNEILSKDMLILYLGISHLSDPGSPYVFTPVKNIRVHDEYDPTRYYNDLAIIELQRPVQFNNFLRPVCLWDGDLEIESLLEQHEYWPWHAAIMMLTNPEIHYHCGGTLITDRFVLTAARCVTVASKNEILSKDMLILYLGISHLSDPGSPYVFTPVKNIRVHDEYDPTRYYNDLAIIELQRPVQFNNFLRPVCLWDGDLEIESLLEQHGTVIGYGTNKGNTTSFDLMMANMLIVGLEKCLHHDRNFFSQFISSKTYCAAGDQKGTAICSGDSGSGMVISKASPIGKDKMWYIRGLVSVSPRDSNNICNTKSCAIFTDVAQYINWIQEAINLK